MKFSVIIPLYNKAPYVRKALESVFAQTYTDFELIVVDDGSTDDSASIAEDIILTSRPSPLASRLIKQENQGVSAARNNGISTSKGEYVAFLDADDWWEPTFLEKMAQLISDYPEAGLYASNYYYHKDGKNIVKVDIPTGYFNYPQEYYKNFAMPVTSISVVIPRNVLDETGGFPLGIKLGEDFLLWAKIAMQYKVAFLNEPLAYYNNTLPPNHRATYKLHKPEEHMLFKLEQLGDEVMGLFDAKDNDWKRLIDMLRVHGLYDYWLSDEYHDVAQEELDKVYWNNQHDFLVQMYDKSRWYLKIKQKLFRIASQIKRKLRNIKS